MTETTKKANTANHEYPGLLLRAIGQSVELKATPDKTKAKIEFEKQWDEAKRPMHFSARSEQEKLAAWEGMEESLEGFTVIGRLLSYRQTEGFHLFRFDGDENYAKIPVDVYTWTAYFEV